MNATRFAEEIGIQRAAMSHLMKGRNNPSADVLNKIVERFDTINARWLLSGKGSMRNESGGGAETSVNKNISSERHSLGNEPDLFNQLNTRTHPIAPVEENIREEIRFTDKINEGDEVKSPNNVNEIIEKEVVIYKERPVKTIDKLLIFYSDNTYETFIPEKHE